MSTIPNSCSYPPQQTNRSGVSNAVATGLIVGGCIGGASFAGHAAGAIVQNEASKPENVKLVTALRTTKTEVKSFVNRQLAKIGAFQIGERTIAQHLFGTEAEKTAAATAEGAEKVVPGLVGKLAKIPKVGLIAAAAVTAIGALFVAHSAGVSKGEKNASFMRYDA